MSPEDLTPQESRENPDPEEAGNPIPRWVLGLALLLALGCASYILRVNASTATEYGDQRTVSDLRQQPKPAGGAASAADGATIFAARCAACHQATGAGLPGVFPPLAGSNWVNGRDTTVIQIVLHGIQGSLTVNGVKYNGAMGLPVMAVSTDPRRPATVHCAARWPHAGPRPAGHRRCPPC